MQPSGGVPRCIQLVRPGAQPVAGAAQIGAAEPGWSGCGRNRPDRPAGRFTRNATAWRKCHAASSRSGADRKVVRRSSERSGSVSVGLDRSCSLEWLRKNRLDRLLARSVRPGRRRRRSPASARRWRLDEKPASGPPGRGTAETTPNTETAGPSAADPSAVGLSCAGSSAVGLSSASPSAVGAADHRSTNHEEHCRPTGSRYARDRANPPNTGTTTSPPTTEASPAGL